MDSLDDFVGSSAEVFVAQHGSSDFSARPLTFFDALALRTAPKPTVSVFHHALDLLAYPLAQVRVVPGEGVLICRVFHLRQPVKE